MKQFVVISDFASFHKGDVIADAGAILTLKASHAHCLCAIEAANSPAAPVAPLTSITPTVAVAPAAPIHTPAAP